MHTRVESSAATAAPRRLEGRRIVTYFQPIFSVRRRLVVGLEALSRGVGPGRRADRARVAVQDRAGRGALGGGRGRLPRKRGAHVRAPAGAPRRGAAVPEPGRRRQRQPRVGGRRAAGAGLRRRHAAVPGRRRVPGGALRRPVAVRRAGRRAAPTGVLDGAGRRRRRPFEPRSHPAVPAGHHQDRPQPDHRRPRRLLQAGDAEEPGQPEPAHRRAGRRRRDRDRGRGGDGAGAGVRSAAGIFPGAPAARGRLPDHRGRRRRDGRRRGAGAIVPQPHGRRDPRSPRGASPAQHAAGRASWAS